MDKSSKTSEGKRHALLLAAGESTRFCSSLPKVAHSLCGRPILSRALDRLEGVGLDTLLVVVGHEAARIEPLLAGRPVTLVRQERQLGTGHAVLSALPRLERLSGHLLISYGDAPLIRTETLQGLLSAACHQDLAMVLLTTRMEDPTGYGRIVREEGGRILDIIEEKDASPEQRKIREVNAGFYCFAIDALLGALPRLEPSPATGEYYLTDLVRVLLAQGRKVGTLSTDLVMETRGINTRSELAQAEAFLRQEIRERWMREGVTLVDPSSVLIDPQVEIGPDTVIHPGVRLLGETRIGSSCVIHGYCLLENARIGPGTIVDHCSLIRDSSVEGGATIGPFAHLRQGTSIAGGARIGNFVEVKKSQVGRGSKAAHLTYLGDAEVGSQVNIGAGTITCNYDGKKKHPTVIEDGAFVGSNSQLIAPVRVGRGAYVAAGSTVTEDVPQDSLAIARSRQVIKKEWKGRPESRRSNAEKAKESG